MNVGVKALLFLLYSRNELDVKVYIRDRGKLHPNISLCVQPAVLSSIRMRGNPFSAHDVNRHMSIKCVVTNVRIKLQIRFLSMIFKFLMYRGHVGSHSLLSIVRQLIYCKKMINYRTWISNYILSHCYYKKLI